jgi:hypothetical protein
MGKKKNVPELMNAFDRVSSAMAEPNVLTDLTRASNYVVRQIFHVL